jgi:hypothetical protein
MKAYMFVPLLALLCGCMSIQQKNAALLQAARTGDTATVNRMLDKHADINARDWYGDTALNLAIKNGQRDTAGLLISKGANVNAKGALGDTPLHDSIYKGDDAMTSLLRSKGADESLLNSYGLNPADMQALPELQAKIVETAKLLSLEGEWSDPSSARTLYDGLKAHQDKYLVNALVLQIIKGDQMRLQVLLLAIKLGIAGSEEKLVGILMVYGDKSMAEDYLNCGSDALADGGRKWANAHGFNILTGPGSHRSGWGQF